MKGGVKKKKKEKCVNQKQVILNNPRRSKAPHTSAAAPRV
jgi:hypothetical protein